MTANRNQQLYKTSQITKMLNVDKMTIYRWRKDGKLKMSKVNGRYYATGEELDNMLNR